MNALLEFDEKEFWIQLFSIVARREEKTEDQDIQRHSAPKAPHTSLEAIFDVGGRASSRAANRSAASIWPMVPNPGCPGLRE